MTGKNGELYRLCERAAESALPLWERLVNIDTGSGYGEGLAQAGGLVGERLKELGAQIQTHPVAGGDGQFHLSTSFRGEGKGTLLVLAHLDTVFPVGAAKERPFKIEGGKVWGPGVCDEKGGIVLCLEALRILKETGFKGFGTLTCLFNCDEEIFSPDSRPMIRAEARRHAYTLCLEPGRLGDGVVAWRKGGGVLTVETAGRAAHAGNAPQAGRNAAMEILHQVGELARLGDESKGTTVNFTVLKAGERVNVIPDHAVAQADVRALYAEEFDRVERTATEISGRTSIPDTRVKTTLLRNNPPFVPNAATDRLAQKAAGIYGEIGRTLGAQGSGGVADANFAAAEGSTVLDGLGPVGGGTHSENEYAELDSVAPRLYLLTRLIMDLGMSG